MPMMPPQGAAPSPQGPPQGAPQGGPSPGAPQPSQLLAQAMKNLMQVGEMMSQAKGIPPEEVKQYGQIVMALKNFIEQNLGAAQGQKPPAGPQPMQSPKPMQAGGNASAQPAPPY